MASILAADALITDPPYGINYRVAERNQRATPKLRATKSTQTKPIAPIHGDDKPFDPGPFLLAPKSAFFGAQHFAARLPHNPQCHYIVWDKRCGATQDDHADGELIWISTKGVLRIHRQKWRGVIRAGEENCSRQKKLHPNQKPVALIAEIIEHLRLPSACTIADPFMGSGSTAIAALRAGHKFVGCEIDAEHFAMAVWRIRQEIRTLRVA